MLLELAAHLESKAAQLKQEGLGKLKVALAGTDTSSLTRLLEGCFGSVDPSPPSPSASTEITEPPEEHPTEEASGNEPSSPIAESSISTAQLVFPMKSIPLVITGIPETSLPFVAQKPCHIIDASSQTAPKSFHRKHQLATTFVVTI